MKAINKHGLRIHGLKKASGLTKEYGAYYGHFVEIFYNMSTGHVWGVYQYSIGQNSWTVYDDTDIVKICNTYHHMTMQEIADAIYDRTRCLNRYGFDGSDLNNGDKGE